MLVKSKKKLNHPQAQAFFPVNLPEITLGRVKAPHVMYFHYASAVFASCCFKKHMTRQDSTEHARRNKRR